MTLGELETQGSIFIGLIEKAIPSVVVDRQGEWDEKRSWSHVDTTGIRDGITDGFLSYRDRDIPSGFQ